jgi:DHA1 family inner membrane transport protein
MLVFRFLSGLPHGAYFGVAALVAASIAPLKFGAPGRSSTPACSASPSRPSLGVPLAQSASARSHGWRWGFGIVALLALLTMALIFAYAPRDRVVPGASPLRELGALRSRQVWLTLAIGAIGFGGMFAVYTYLASTLMEVTRVSPAMVPLVLGIFGLGLTAGTLAGAWAADRALMPSIGGMLLWTAAALALFPLAAGNFWTISIVVFLIGTSGGLGAMLQTRLMDVAGEAQTLAAALNHSAFNTANALGPWLGGLAIAAGHGWTSTGWVGTGLALAGFLIWVVALLDQRARAAR